MQRNACYLLWSKVDLQSQPRIPARKSHSKGTAKDSLVGLSLSLFLEQMRCRGMLAIYRGFDYLSVMLYKGEDQARLATHKHRPPRQLASISNLEQLMCLKSDNFDVANSWMSLTELKNLRKLRLLNVEISEEEQVGEEEWTTLQMPECFDSVGDITHFDLSTIASLSSQNPRTITIANAVFGSNPS
ncbi:hypothetical protein ACLOJK_028324 [Asimina triloba]